MRRPLGRFGVRGGVAVGLAILVLAAGALARLAGGGARPNEYSEGTQPASTVDPTAGDDGEVGTSPSAYPDDAAVRAAAATFTEVWLRRDLSPKEWHSRVALLATASLTESLEGADPTGVPATRMVGEPRLVLRADRYSQVAVPVDTGTVLLGLLKRGGWWLVDGVDWDRL